MIDWVDSAEFSTTDGLATIASTDGAWLLMHVDGAVFCGPSISWHLLLLEYRPTSRCTRWFFDTLAELDVFRCAVRADPVTYLIEGLL